MSTSKQFRTYTFVSALVIGMLLAAGASVWATSVGTDVTVTGSMAVQSSSASSSVTYAFGVGTTTPSMQLSVGGAEGTATGHVYLTGGLGVGIATTTAGGLQLTGNTLFGDASADLLMYNSAALVFNNAGTSTIPSANANAWSYATSSANIPLVKFDTSNTRVGISTTSPLATLSVDGTAVFTGTLGVGTSSPATTFSVIGNDYITGGL